MELLIIMFAVMAVFVIWSSRKQKKQMEEQQSFLESLQPGVEVQTASGYVGTIVSVEGDRVALQSEPGSGITVWVKAAIRKPTAVAADIVVDEPAHDTEIAEIDVPDYVSDLIDKPGSPDDKGDKKSS